MQRFLPPLVVLLLLGFVAWRVAQDPRRARERERIEATWSAALDAGGDNSEQLEDIRRHLEHYGSTEDDRWFAARALLKNGAVASAIEVVWRDPGIRASDGAGRELAGLLLRNAGFLDDETLERPLPGANLVTTILADGGDENALERLTSVVENDPWEALVGVHYAVSLYGGADVRQVVVNGLRHRERATMSVAASILAARPQPYPERQTDLDRLREVVRSGRQEGPGLWALACGALGRMESPEGIADLEAQLESLRTSSDPAARADAAVAALGLVAGGRWEAEEQAAPFLAFDDPQPALLDAYLHAVTHRWNQGDPQALEPIRTWWERGARHVAVSARRRLSVRLFLADELPPANGPLTPFEESLSAQDAHPDERLLGAAIRLRRGDREARDDLVEALRVMGNGWSPREDPGLALPTLFSPVVQALRALYLYDR